MVPDGTFVVITDVESVAPSLIVVAYGVRVYVGVSLSSRIKRSSV